MTPSLREYNTVILKSWLFLDTKSSQSFSVSLRSDGFIQIGLRSRCWWYKRKLCYTCSQQYGDSRISTKPTRKPISTQINWTLISEKKKKIQFQNIHQIYQKPKSSQSNRVLIVIAHIKKPFGAIFKITSIKSTWDNSNIHAEVQFVYIDQE